MNKVLIIGDSLSMVRPDQDIKHEDIYAYLLQQELNNDGYNYFVLNASCRANSSQNAVSTNFLCETLDSIKPDLIVYFLGIVDCMPRLFGRYQRLLIRAMMSVKLLRILGKLIISYHSRNRYLFTQRKLIQFVPIDSWKENLEKFVEKTSCKIVFVNIPHPGKQLQTRNFEIEKIIKDYNNCLNVIAENNNAIVLNFYNETFKRPDLLLDDGYHITKNAHQWLTKELLNIIKPETKNNLKTQAEI
ncbi:MAG: SGNH/GDSL hydrolase family protein [Methylophilus sp.]|uniref:SGNH/GDSL hydrolase family protein n=1 Tax=Methylophilus sp. TaxID=29541 RepID=UPI003FA04F70